MKQFLLSLALLLGAFSMQAADATDFTVNLADAVWNFDDYSGTKPSISSDNFVVPTTWVVGNGGTSKPSSAYTPFIYPSKTETVKSYGYDGRLCMRIYSIASAARVAPFAMLPKVAGESYANLKLQFMGRGEESITDKTYYYRLRIGYIRSLSDTLRANFNAAVVNFHDETFSADAYQQYSISLAGIPDSAYVVLYDDDVTVINSVLLDNISFVKVVTQPEEVTVDTTATVCDSIVWRGTTYKRSGNYTAEETVGNVHTTYTLHLTVNNSVDNDLYVKVPEYYDWNGKHYTETGDYIFRSTTKDGCDSVVTLHLTITPMETRACSVYAYYPNLQACFRWGVKVRSFADETVYAAALLDSIVALDKAVEIDGINAGFIEEISVTAPDGVTYTGELDGAVANEMGYWMYNINDEFAQLGVLSQPIQDGDFIFWQYQTDWSSPITKVNELPQNIYYVDFGTVNYAPVYADTTAVTCDSLFWKGFNYTASGSYTEVEVLNEVRHHTTLHLTVNESSEPLELTETHTDSCIWNGVTYTESGDYIFRGTNEQGCDSVVTLHLTIEKTVALPNVSLEATVWPNPTTDKLHIDASGAIFAQVYDATGKLVMAQPFEESISVAHLADGLYMLRVSTADGRHATTPFVKK